MEKLYQVEATANEWKTIISVLKEALTDMEMEDKEKDHIKGFLKATRAIPTE